MGEVHPLRDVNMVAGTARRTTWKARLAAAIAALGLLVLAGCGGAGGSGGSGGTGGAGSSGEGGGQAAGDYPSKPIVVVAPAGPGSGWDLTARTVSRILTEEKIVPVAMPVENRQGGGGSVALSYMANEKKGDPYTLVVFSPPLLLINLNGTTPLSYQDLTPIARLYTDYQIIVVKADSPYQNLKQVLDALKADPKSVTVGGASSPGSMDHLSFMLPAKLYGVDIKNIPYVSFQSGSELMAALLGGQVDVVSTGVGEVLPQLEAGTIRALAVTAPQRYDDPRLKDVPTLKDAGIDATFEVWRGVFGPKDMPEEARAYMEQALEKMVQTEAWKTTAQQNNWTTAFLPGEQFEQFLAEQNQMLKEMLVDLGLAK